MIVIVPKALRGALEFVAVDLPNKRLRARLRRIDRCVAFARRHELVTEDQETELAEMLLYGARFPDAVSELRADIHSAIHGPPGDVARWRRGPSA
jgi:hypothetical protein